MKLIETHCHGKDCERKNNCYRYVILQEKLKNNPSQALWFVQSSSCYANNYNLFLKIKEPVIISGSLQRSRSEDEAATQ